MAVGLGFDIHPFDVEHSMVLGGVDIPSPAGLRGHSDGDVVIHAITDALLGAIGDADIGELFPDTDEHNRDRDSAEFLQEAVGRVRSSGNQIVNVDCVIAIEQPMIAPYREKMCVNLSSIVGAPVHVKAKRGEGMGAIGRSEGVACWAVAQIERVDK
jgi:2-C-methyl-D-erythritol 2,4-cyclodiphosphate synthase